MRIYRLIAALLAIQLLCPFGVLAQAVTTTPHVHHHVHTPVNLNLSSTAASAHAGHLTQGAAVNINVGGQLMQVTHSTLLTPAERVALYQVVSSGHQSLILGSLGNAVGGSFNIGPKLSQFISGLVIPQGVTAVDHLGSSGTLNLSGNLTNAGTLYAVSSNPSVNTAVINALNIYNLQGGLLSSNLNLLLNATNNILNAGTIRSAGNLTLTAGNSITNSASGATALIQAAGNVNLNSANITNSGLVSSLNNNINIASATAQNISVNNTNGVLQALNGAVNVRDASFTANNNFNLTGGDVLSKELSIYSGSGVVDVNVGNVTGVVNVTGGSGAISAETPNLLLGAMNFTGDPVFSNTGNFVISSPESFSGQALAIVAGGNITTATGATIIDTSTTANNTNGGSITLVAGAAFTPSVNNSDPLTITGASATGGKIDLLTGTAITSINSSATGTGSNAGSIQLIAFKGTGTGSGSITLPSNMPINANSTNGTAGNVTMIAGGANTVSFGTDGTAPVAISGGTTGSGTSTVVNSIGSISASGATGGGNVSISAATPMVSTGGVTITGGAITNGSFSAGASQSGQLYLGPITSSGNLSVSAGNFIILDKAVSVGGNATVTTTANNGGIIVNSNFVAGGSVNMTANGSGEITTPNQLIANPGVGLFAFGAALTPNGQFAYVPNNTDNTVSVIRTSDNTVIATISLSSFNMTSPKGAVVSPDGSVVYVVGASTTSGEGVVAVISTSSQSVTTTYTIQASNSTFAVNFDPQLVAVAPSGLVYVMSDYAGGVSTATAPNQLTVINPANPSLPNQVNITMGGLGKGTDLGGLAVNPQGTLAYVANTGSNSITVVNLSTNSPITTINLPALSPHNLPFEPVALAFNTTGTRLYVGQSDANFGSSEGRVLTVDSTPTSATFDQVLSTQSGQFSSFLPQAITSSPTGTQLWVNPTYSEVGVVMNPLTLQIMEVPGIGTSTAPDGYGSNTFSGIVTNSGVRNVQTYIAAPTHTGSAGSVVVFQTPTIQGSSVSLQSGTGNITVNYDAQGGTFRANTGGSVIAGNVGSAASTVGASSVGTTGQLFELGAMNGLTISGAITGSAISITATNGGIALGANVGTTASSVTLDVGGTGTITRTAGTVSGSTVTLNTSGGDVGTGSALVQLQAPAITVNSTGNIFLSSLGAITSLRAPGTSFLLSQSGALTVTSSFQLSAPVITLITTNSGALTINTSLGSSEATGTSISLITSGTGAISQSATSLLEAATINLQSGTGSIGSSTAAPLRLETGSLSVTSGGSAFLSNTGNLTLTSDQVASTLSLVTSGNLSVNFTSIGSQPTTLSLQTLNTGNIDIASNIGFLVVATTITGSTVTLTSGGAITSSNGSTVRGLSVNLKSGTNSSIGVTGHAINVQALNLSATSGLDAFLNGDGSQTGGVILAKSSALGTFNLSESGVIVQSAAGTILTAPNINLQTAGSGNNLGSATIPLGLSSGTASALTLNAQSGGNTFLTVAPTGTLSGAVTLSGANTAATGTGVFKLSAAGPITIRTGSTITAGNSAALITTGTNASITQQDGSTVTTIFAPAVTLATTTGTAANIGSSSNNPIVVAANSTTPAQSVNLTVNSAANAFISAANTGNSVSANFVGTSSAGTGATVFSVLASGNINIANTTALGGKITDTTGTISLTAGTGGSVTQSQSSTIPSLTAVEVDLTADSSGTQGTVGSSTVALNVSAGTLNGTAGGSIFLQDGIPTRAKLVALAGSAQLSDPGAVTFTGQSSAATTFTTTTPSTITFGVAPSTAGSVSSGTSVTLSASGFSQVSPSSQMVITSPTVNLTAGASGIGSLGHALGIASQAGSVPNPVTLNILSAGAIYLNGGGVTSPTSAAGYLLGVPISSPNSNLGTLVNITVAGDFSDADNLRASTSFSVTTTAAGTAHGDISQNTGCFFFGPVINLNAAGYLRATVQGYPSAASPVTLTAISGADNTLMSNSPVNLAGASGAGAAGTTGYSLSAAGSIVFNAGASITSTTGGAAVSLTTSAKGSITQLSAGTPTAPAVSIFSPNITLQSDTTTTGTMSTIGTSTTMPLVVSPGTSASPLTLSANSFSNSFISVPNVTISSTLVTGNVTLTGINVVASTSTTGQFYLSAGGSISQSALTNITSIFAPNVTLASQTSTIGSSSNAMSFAVSPTNFNSQTVNLNTNAAGNVTLSAINSNAPLAPVNVVLTGTSKDTAAGTTYTLSSTGNISQTVAGLSLVAPAIVLTAVGNIGTSTTTPIGINSGISNTPVNLTATAGSLNNNIFVAGTTYTSGVGAVNLTGISSATGQFYLSSTGAISQTGTSTTIYSPTVTLSTTGAGTSIGLGNPIVLANNQSTSAQIVTVNANATSGSVLLSALNSTPSAAAVEMDFFGNNTANGTNATFSAQATGNVTLLTNSNNARITASTGTISLAAGTGSNITQTNATTVPVLTATTVNLTADFPGGNSGTIGSSGSLVLATSAANLNASAGGSIFLQDGIPTRAKIDSLASSVQFSDNAGITFVGASSAATSFTATTPSTITFGVSPSTTGSISGTSVTLSASGFSQSIDPANFDDISSNTVTLTSGASGVGSATHPLGIASQAGSNTPAPVNLNVVSTGAVYINGYNSSASNAGFVLGNSSSGSTFSLVANGSLSQAVPGTTTLKATTLILGATGGSIALQLQNATLTAPVTLTSNSGSDTSITSLSPVNFASLSGTGTAATTGFTLSAGGSIVFNANASITSDSATASTGNAVSLTTANGSKGSITQLSAGTATAPAVSIFSPKVTLTTDTTIATTNLSTIGSSTALPLILNSGTSSTPVTLTANSISNTFISVATANGISGAVTLSGSNAVASTATASQFYLTANGAINVASGATVSSPGTVTLATTGSNNSISQGGTATTLFAPKIVFTTGSGGSIGSGSQSMVIAASATATTTQTVNLTATATGTGNAFITGSDPNATVNVNVIGASGAGGASGFNLSTAAGTSANAGGINLAATITAPNSITLSIPTNGGNITQTTAGINTLVSTSVTLLTNGNVGTTTTNIGIGSGSTTAPVTLAVVGPDLSTNAGSVFVSSVSPITFSGTTPTFANAFSLKTTGNISFVAGSVVSGSTSVSLVTSGTGSITSAGGQVLLSPSITLSAGTGGIGTGGTNGIPLSFLGISAPVAITASSTGSVFLTNTESGTGGPTVLQGSSSAGGTSGFNLSTVQSITQAIAGTTITSARINLSSSNGSVGGLIPLGIANAAGITLTASGSTGVTLNATGPVTFATNSASSAPVFTLTSSGSITMAAGATVTGSAALSLTTGTAGGITQADPSSTSTIFSPSITISAGSLGVGTAAKPVGMDSAFTGNPSNQVNLALTSKGSVYMSGNPDSTNTSGITNFQGASITGTFSFATQEPVRISSTVTATTSITMTVTGTGTGAGNGITQVGNATALASPIIALSTSPGDIGSSNQSLLVSNSSVSMPLTLSANTGGNVFLTAAGAVNLGASSANPDMGPNQGFTLTTLGNLAVTAPLNAGSINLNATGATPSVSNISTSGTGTITGLSVSLFSTTGSIGTSSVALVVNSPSSSSLSLVQLPTLVTAVTGGAGTVNVNDKDPAGVTLQGASSSGGAFSLTSAGPTTVAGSVTTNASPSTSLGNLTLKETAGAMNINGNLTANGGSILVQNSDITSGSISIGNAPTAVTISTNVTTLNNAPKGTNGQVAIIIGTTTSTANQQSSGTVGNITYTTTGVNGKIYLGQTPSAILAPTAPVAVNGTNQTVFFNSPSASHTIRLGADVTITADPVVVTGVTTQPMVSAPGAPVQSNAPAFIPSTTAAPASLPQVQSVQPSGSFPVVTDTVRRNSITAPASADRQITPDSTFEGQDIGSSDIMLFDNNGLRSTQITEKSPARFTSNPDLQPVSSFTGTSEAATTAAVQLNTISAATNSFSLRQGGVLFAPARAMTVKTPHGQVSVGANAVALVVVTRDGVAVYNLHDSRCGDVSISNGTTKYSIGLGRHALISHNKSSYEDINPVPYISHADMEAADLPGGGKLFRSKFSMASAVSGLQTVSALQSSTNPHDRKLSARLMKNAAIFTQMQRTGAYRRMVAAPKYVTAQK